MNINIICIGKLKEKYWQAAVAEYTKRIGGYARIQIVELKESKLPKNASPADESQVMEKEGETILSKIGESDYVIAMEVEGKMLDSVELSRHLTKTFDSGRSTVDFHYRRQPGAVPGGEKAGGLRAFLQPHDLPSPDGPGAAAGANLPQLQDCQQ